MAILKIAKMGHPVLRMTAKAVADPTAAEIRRLAQDMLDTMEDAEGTGLAAPQVHVPLRMVIFYVKGDRLALEDDEPERLAEAAHRLALFQRDRRSTSWHGTEPRVASFG